MCVLLTLNCCCCPLPPLLSLSAAAPFCSDAQMDVVVKLDDVGLMRPGLSLISASTYVDGVVFALSLSLSADQKCCYHVMFDFHPVAPGQSDN